MSTFAVLGILAATIIDTTGTVSSQSYYYNEKNVQMSKADYNQLLTLGFDASEISSMD